MKKRALRTGSRTDLPIRAGASGSHFGHHAGVNSEYVTGLCADGPLEGQEVLQAMNQLGWTVTISTLTSTPGNNAGSYIYELVALGSLDAPARLRFVREDS